MSWPRSDIDLGKRTIRVTRQMTEVRGSGLAFGPSKSRAGRRVVPIPAVIVPVIDRHLSCFAQDGDDGLVFTSPRGMLLRHSLFRQRVWLPALKSAGLADVHFAMIYLHGSDKRQQVIADAHRQLAIDELKRGSKRDAPRPRGGRSGTQRARKRHEAS